jgi:hypothetical protein
MVPVLLELVQVAIGPAHARLKSVVKTAKQRRARHPASSPDWWLNIEELDLQLRRWALPYVWAIDILRNRRNKCHYAA